VKFLTPDECGRFYKEHDAFGIAEAESLQSQSKKPAGGPFLMVTGQHGSQFYLPAKIASWLGEWDEALLWVTDWGIWPSSENQYTYYRVRQSYGDTHNVKEYPGHLFEKGETKDLLSFVELLVWFGWGFHIVTVPKSIQCFHSHDEWLRIKSDFNSQIEEELLADKVECHIET